MTGQHHTCRWRVLLVAKAHRGYPSPASQSLYAILWCCHGFGFQLACGVLNNTLTLDHMIVTANTMTTSADDFWPGGGRIVHRDGTTLSLIDSLIQRKKATGA